MEFAYIEANKNRIREVGGVAKLIVLLRDQNVGVRSKVTGALCELAWNNEANKNIIRQMGGVERLIVIER
jgi:hypothetical protein